MLLDADLLVHAVDETTSQHAAASWLTRVRTATERVELPWQTIGTFLRVTTDRRITAQPLSSEEAWSFVDEWLAQPVTWIPPATERTARTLGRLLQQHGVTGKVVPDARLAALTIELGVVLHSADTDFARFDELRWVNPLQSH